MVLRTEANNLKIVTAFLSELKRTAGDFQDRCGEAFDNVDAVGSPVALRVSWPLLGLVYDLFVYIM